MNDLDLSKDENNINAIRKADPDKNQESKIIGPLRRHALKK